MWVSRAVRQTAICRIERTRMAAVLPTTTTSTALVWSSTFGMRRFASSGSTDLDYYARETQAKRGNSPRQYEFRHARDRGGNDRGGRSGRGGRTTSSSSSYQGGGYNPDRHRHPMRRESYRGRGGGRGGFGGRGGRNSYQRGLVEPRTDETNAPRWSNSNSFYADGGRGGGDNSDGSNERDQYGNGDDGRGNNSGRRDVRDGRLGRHRRASMQQENPRHEGFEYWNRGSSSSSPGTHGAAAAPRRSKLHPGAHGKARKVFRPRGDQREVRDDRRRKSLRDDDEYRSQTVFLDDDDYDGDDSVLEESYPKGRPKESYHQDQPSNTKNKTARPFIRDSSAILADPSLFPPRRLAAYVACQPGLVPLLTSELDSLGLAYNVKGNGVELTPTMSVAPPAPPTSLSVNDLLQCHLHLGTATNVFVRCGSPFTVRALGELRRKVSIMPWRQLLVRSNYDNNKGHDAIPRFNIKVASAKSRLMHSTAIRDNVLAGIYTSLGYADSEAQKDLNNKLKDKDQEDVVRLTVQMYHDQAQISLDSSSMPLHKRGYRFETGKAPLREDLAFAFLSSVGWKQRYLSAGKSPRDAEDEELLYTSFLDPFCGSGTLAIEAASMAAGLPPGRLRPAPLNGTVLHDPSEWKKLVDNAEKRSTDLDTKGLQIQASDRDKGAVMRTRSNAERAGIAQFLKIRDCAFAKHPWLDAPESAPSKMLLIGNLPFGRRIKAPPKLRNTEKNPLLPLYQSLSTRVSGLKATKKAFGAAFLTDDTELFRWGGFKTQFDQALRTKHGGIPVCAMYSANEQGDALNAALTKRCNGEEEESGEPLESASHSKEVNTMDTAKKSPSTTELASNAEEQTFEQPHRPMDTLANMTASAYYDNTAKQISQNDSNKGAGAKEIATARDMEKTA